jgi:uncharacterized protein (TIGR02266 family)
MNHVQNTMEQSLTRIHVATDRDALLEAALSSAKRHLEPAKLFVVRKGEIRGYLALEKDQLDRAAIARQALTLGEGSLASTAAESGILYLGPLPEGDPCAGLFSEASPKKPDLVVLPIAIKERTVFLLLGLLKTAITPELRQDFTQLGQVTALALASLIVRNKDGQASAAPPAPVLLKKPKAPPLVTLPRPVTPQAKACPGPAPGSSPPEPALGLKALAETFHQLAPSPAKAQAPLQVAPKTQVIPEAPVQKLTAQVATTNNSWLNDLDWNMDASDLPATVSEQTAPQTPAPVAVAAPPPNKRAEKAEKEKSKTREKSKTKEKSKGKNKTAETANAPEAGPPQSTRPPPPARPETPLPPPPPPAVATATATDHAILLEKKKESGKKSRKEKKKDKKATAEMPPVLEALPSTVAVEKPAPPLDSAPLAPTLEVIAPMATAPLADDQPSAESQRHFPRLPLTVEVTFTSEHNFYTGFLQNISCGGIFVATYEIINIGQKVELEFSLPGLEGHCLTRCEVRWLRDYNPLSPETIPGMGLRFIELQEHVRVAVERFLRQRDPIFFDE